MTRIKVLQVICRVQIASRTGLCVSLPPVVTHHVVVIGSVNHPILRGAACSPTG